MADLDDSGFFVDPEGEDLCYMEGLDGLDKYVMPNRLYDVLKWVGLVILPALAWFVSVVGPAWGYSVDAIVTTINALGTLIGLCIGASQLSSMGR